MRIKTVRSNNPPRPSVSFQKTSCFNPHAEAPKKELSPDRRRKTILGLPGRVIGDDNDGLTKSGKEGRRQFGRGKAAAQPSPATMFRLCIPICPRNVAGLGKAPANLALDMPTLCPRSHLSVGARVRH